MSWSRDKTELLYTVVNPYNFVPLGEKPTRSNREETYRDATSLLSGWLDILLTPETELIIPDGQPRKGKEPDAEPVLQNDKESHRFFRFYRKPDGTPAIPGSTLHGMLRSVYEAASNSCFTLLLDDGEITTRTPVYGSWKHRGLLGKQNGKWTLYAAIQYKDKRPFFLSSDGKWYGKSNGEKVQFTFGKKQEVIVEDKGRQSGWLQFQKPVNSRDYYASVLVPERRIRSWDDDMPYCELKAVLTAKDGNPTKQSEMLLCALEKVEKGSGDLVPVWYKIVGNECYLSHSSIGRVLQRNKWRDILGNYAPCSDPASLCPACQLFGTTEAGGFKGRISCGDAVPVYGIRQESLQFRELPILAGPRPSAFEFYLKRPVPNATYWNFDYHVVGLQDSAEYRSVPNTGIRGRKFYWHSIPDKTDARPQNDKMNTTMEILSPGEKNSFRFRLFFDRITEEQLSQLIWVVTLGENKADGRQMHKIGHGRPLGYGSVRLTVEKKTIRKFVREDNGTVNFLLQEEKLPEEVLCPWPDTGAVKAILAMTHINAASGKVVGYPMEEGKKGDVTIYNWFGKNRRSKGPDQLLPYPVVKNKNLAVSEAASLKTSLPPEEYTIDAANQRAAGKKDWSGQIVTVRIIEIKPKGAACKMPDGSKGYLKGNQQLTNKSGDRCEVRVTEFSNDFNSWQLIPVKKERVKGV